MKTLPDKSVDMVLTDPPYGTTACRWDVIIPFEPMWEQLKRITKDNGAICLFGSEPFSSALRMSNIKIFRYDWIWYKNTCSGVSLSKYQPMRSHEIISVFYLQRPTFNKLPTKSRIENIETREGKIRKRNNNVKVDFIQMKKSIDNIFSSNVNPRSVLEFNSTNNANGKYHPTQKPVALLEYLIKTYTIENETVLDFTMGSGSTGVACNNLNRKFIGIERDDKYFEIAQGRINGT
jgi:site-specific DNA-methyltransferase (adenine-specific)